MIILDPDPTCKVIADLDAEKVSDQSGSRSATLLYWTGIGGEECGGSGEAFPELEAVLGGARRGGGGGDKAGCSIGHGGPGCAWRSAYQPQGTYPTKSPNVLLFISHALPLVATYHYLQSIDSYLPTPFSIFWISVVVLDLKFCRKQW